MSTKKTAAKKTVKREKSKRIQASNSLKVGEQRRKILPRAALAEWDASLRRQEPLETLRQAMSDRVPALIALKYQRMALSPFVFFRGAAPIMASDLALSRHTGVLTQLCGDAHVQNLGAYGGPDGGLIFDINDFDETIRGPFEWDVKRMATSILLAGHESGIKRQGCVSATHTFLSAYCSLSRKLATMPILEVARYQVHRLGSIASISEILSNAERATPLHSLEHLTEPCARGRRFKSAPPFLCRVTGSEAKAVLASLNGFTQSLIPARQHFIAQFKPIDVAFKVVGTGSIGLRDYCVYMEGNGPSDPLFIQIKQEVASAYARYLPERADLRENQGKRVAEGQQAMQFQTDPLLGWTTLDGRDYLVRQLNDHKASINITKLIPNDLAQYATVCGEALARGHARSGDAWMIAGYLGGGKRFTAAILDFAIAYAEQTVDDWKALLSQNKTAR